MLEVQVDLKSSPESQPAAPLTIGQLARRSGVATSALRFYEAEGLIAGSRSPGGHRQYPRHVRTPTKADWTRLSAGWAPLLDERIAALQQLRERLTGCIGCGCLSLKACALYNPEDKVSDQGAGARLLRIETKS
jgi:MerR family transcriptional regulator, redox-sensitive transcriptional activator SoxR